MARSATVRRPDRAGELGQDVVEQRHVVRADHRPVPGDLADLRRDHPQVALVDAGQHLADEARPGRSGEREAGDGVPQDVHAEWDPDVRPELADDGGHRGRDLRPDLELVRKVGLIAEQDAVDAGGLELLEVAPDDVDEVAAARRLVVLRTTGQGREVQHRDHGLAHAECALEDIHRWSL